MQIGNVIITTEQAQKQEIANALNSGGVSSGKQSDLAQLADYVAKGINQANIEAGQDDATVGVASLNKNLNMFGLPFSSLLTSKISVKSRNTDMQTLKFWSDELPLAPQTIEFIVKSVWSRGWKLTLAEGSKEDLKTKARIERFMRKANQNNSSLKSLLQAMMRHEMRVGNGYLEKIYNKGKTNLAEVRIVKPWNIVVLIDEEDEKDGILTVEGYAKVSDINKADKKELHKNKRIPVWKMVHGKYIDEGDAYGVSPFAKNQEITKFIINVLNQNQKKFTNDIRHSIHIELGKKSTQTDADIFIAQYRAKYLGQNNYGSPLVTFGDIKVTVLDMENSEFDFKEFLKEVGMNHAPSLLNVSPSEIINNDAKYSNASQGHITTVLNTIFDWQDKLESMVNYQLIPELQGIMPDDKGVFPDDQVITYKFELERENLFTMYQYLKDIVPAVKAAIMSPNEARKIVDSKHLPFIVDEDGTPAEWADDHWYDAGKAGLIDMDEEAFTGTDNADDTDTTQQKSFATDAGELRRMNKFFDSFLKSKEEKDKLQAVEVSKK